MLGELMVNAVWCRMLCPAGQAGSVHDQQQHEVATGLPWKVCTTGSAGNSGKAWAMMIKGRVGVCLQGSRGNAASVCRHTSLLCIESYAFSLTVGSHTCWLAHDFLLHISAIHCRVAAIWHSY